MALQKRRLDENSLPDGLMKAKVDLVKGMAVTRRLNAETKEYEVDLPQAGDTIYGFVTDRIDEKIYRDSEYDKIPAGKRCVVYTLVKDGEWATDQFTGELAIGDKVAVGTDGKLVKSADGSDAVFECLGVSKAMAGYEFPLATVKVL